MFARPGAGALVTLALIAAFALVSGITELVAAIGGPGRGQSEAGLRIVLPADVAQAAGVGFLRRPSEQSRAGGE